MLINRFGAETAVLLIATPFLLFPTSFWPGTLLALCLLLLSWIWPAAASPRWPWANTPLNATLLLWSFCLLGGILVSADPDLSLPKLTGLLLGIAVWRYLTWPLPSRYLPAVVVIFVALGLGFTGIGVLSANWVVKIPVLARWLPPRLLVLPTAAEAGIQTNQLAGTILIYLPLLLSLVGLSSAIRSQWLRPFLLLLTGGTAVLLLLTQSRSGWVGGLGGLFVWLCLYSLLLPAAQSRRARQALALFVTLVLLTLAWIGPTRLLELWADPVQETAVGALDSLNFRHEVWQWGLQAVGDFPFTGVGLGTFRRVIFRFYPTQINPTYDLAHAHNIFLQVALDMGLPGLISYGALLLLAGWMGWQIARQSLPWRGVAIGLLSGLAALHIYGLADALALGSKPGLLFWWLLGLLTALWCKQQDGFTL